VTGRSKDNTIKRHAYRAKIVVSGTNLQVQYKYITIK